MSTIDNILDTTTLDDVINNTLEQMDGYDKFATEFEKMAANLLTLYKAKAQLPVEPDRRINVNTLVTVGANLLGILLILHFEKLDFISSKALGFVLKSKI